MALRIGAASAAPTYYNLLSGMSEIGAMSHVDITRSIYNLTVAVAGLCAKFDAAGGTQGTDNRAAITTDLQTAMAKMAIPVIGPVT